MIVGGRMNKYLKNLYNQLYFLDEEERQKIVDDITKKINKQLADGKSEKEALKKIGSIDKIVEKACHDRGLDMEYCLRETLLDKDINNVSKIIANFIREILKVIQKVKLGFSLESFLEVIIKIIVLIFLFVVIKLPFIALEGLSILINRFIFYPFNNTFDLVVNIIISFVYIFICVILTLKVFGTYKPKLKKIVSEKEVEKIDKEYNWLELIIRIVIYIIILIPLVLLTVICFIILIETSYLVSRGIDLIGIPILLAGLFGLLCSLTGTIKDSLNHKKRSYLFPTCFSIGVFIVGVIVTVYDLNRFIYPLGLESSSIGLKEEEKTITLSDFNSRIKVNNGNYEVLLDNNLSDNQVRVVVSYYDDYIDVNYYERKDNEFNYLVFDQKLDKDINYLKVTENIINDLKNGYIFNYSNVLKIKVKVYANERLKHNLES